MIVLSPIEEVELVALIILSVISRLLEGIGTDCALTSIITIFVSDYPENAQIMLGRMEAAVELGLVLGQL